jgi:tetratricopeptide (TPR) repeat protein
LAARSPAAAQPLLSRPSANEFEIRGGEGPASWVLRYGTLSEWKAQLVAAGNYAWLSNGGWLRRIDATRGVVTGRWHFPGIIVRLAPVENRVQVDFEDTFSGSSPNVVFRRTLTLEPGTADVPYWPTLNPGLRSQIEARLQRRQNVAWFDPFGEKLSDDERSEYVARVKDMVGRDPLSPWFRVLYWKLMRDAGDPTGTRLLLETAREPMADYTEMFHVSAFLENVGATDVARAAFDRGYQDFIRQGNDPRFLLSLFLFSGLYPVRGPLSSEQLPEIVERMYRLAPHADLAEFAWRLHADHFEKQGRPEDARLWQQRADEAKSQSNALVPAFALRSDRGHFLLLATILAVLLYLIALSIRYRPQAQFDRSVQPGGRLRKMLSSTFPYWTSSERVVFLTLALIGWSAAGFSGFYLKGVFRLAQFTGDNFSSPIPAWYLETRVPSTPERDLLLAMAHQRAGDSDKAEALYRSLPQFAESWNNLGVLLEDHGKHQDAQDAFQQALTLKPGLAEAAVNLGRSPTTLWTQLHVQYAPGRPMLAPSPRPVMATAFLGGSYLETILMVLGGPLLTPYSLEEIGAQPGLVDQFPHYFIMAALLFAAALFVLIPWRQAALPSGKIHAILEMLLPGTSAPWGLLGGVVLLAWSSWLLHLALSRWTFGTSAILTTDFFADRVFAYGVPADASDLMKFFRPGWAFTYALPIVLVCANLVLVWRARAKR